MNTKLKEVAQKHGWTITTLGQKGAPKYALKKGDLTVEYSRKGYGCISLWWKRFRVPHNFAVYIAVSDETCVDRFLPLITEEQCLRDIESDLQEQVKRCADRLLHAEDDLARFCKLKEK